MDHLKKLLAINYKIEATNVSSIDGYANANYKVETGGGKKYILKKQKTQQGVEEYIEAESKIMALLSRSIPGKFQNPIKNINHNFITKLDEDKDSIYRLISWIDGDFLYEAEQSSNLLDSFGTFLAEMDIILLNQRNPCIEARHIDWDLQILPELEARLSLIKDAGLKKLIHHFILQFKENVVPVYPHLRKSIIHNDANDWNVLVRENKVSSIIDFGDLVYAPLIQELGVALTYVVLDKDDPLIKAAEVIRAYVDILPINEQEVDILYYLVAGRMCMSLLNLAAAKSQFPENNYLSVSERQVKKLIGKWISINPEMACIVFREAAGLPQKEVESAAETLAKRNIYISRVQSVNYQAPIKMTGAAFQYMYDAYGNTFLDAYNNIPHVGHQHPEVVEAGQRQMARLNTNTRYLYDQLAEYAEKLLAKFPTPLNKVFFVNSGSAASDLAIRLAQTHTGFRDIAVLEHGYHGHTRLGIDISHYKFGSKGGRGQADYIVTVPIPDTYHGKYTINDETAGKNYVREAEDIISRNQQPVAAFIAEPIVGCAGQVPLAKAYLKHLYPMIRKQGGVCISDEVQTGFGRVGSHFWGFELQDVIPDIVVLGKPIGNGHPLAAVVTTDVIANSFDNGMEFFSSFGGNPVSCAIGMAVLNVIEAEGLQQHAFETGMYFLSELNKLKDRYGPIGDVRGLGLFIGIEIVKNRFAKEPDTLLANAIKNRLREQFILVSTDGPYDNVIKIKPPMCFNKSNSDVVASQIEQFLIGL